MLSLENRLDLAKCDFMLTTCACLNLRKASRLVTQIFDEALQSSGLRSTQLPVLVTLATIGSTTITHMAQELVMDRTSLARLLKPLETAGLIEIAPGEDRRTRGLSLTERGQEAIIKAIPLWEAAQAFVVERLGHKRWRDFRENLSAAVILVQ
jgi:DNA-binding MarR family transcriptional regulator